MLPVVVLCFIAAFAALGGLAAAGLALMPVGGLATPALFAAPAFGVISLATALTAAAIVLRQQS